MDSQLRQVYHRARATDDPSDWSRFFSSAERLLDPRFYDQLILQFGQCVEDGGLLGSRLGCDPRWCSHIKIRVLGLHVFDEVPPDNPLWAAPCDSCGVKNRTCECGDNMDIYNCDYCGCDALVDDLTPTGKDEYACLHCVKNVGLFTFKLQGSGQWYDPINKRWTHSRMVTLASVKNDAEVWKESDVATQYFERYAAALLHSIDFLGDLEQT